MQNVHFFCQGHGWASRTRSFSVVFSVQSNGQWSQVSLGILHARGQHKNRLALLLLSKMLCKGCIETKTKQQHYLSNPSSHPAL